jgi:hypothetical protein
MLAKPRRRADRSHLAAGWPGEAPQLPPITGTASIATASLLNAALVDAAGASRP